MANLRVTSFLALLALAYGQDCAWDKDSDFPVSFPPLLVDLNTWVTLMPTMQGSSRIVSAANGSTIVVACPGTTISALPGVESVEGVCIGGTSLDVGGKTYTIQGLSCALRVKDDEQKLGTKCGANLMGDEAQTGFNITGYPFVEIIRFCFDPVQEITIYSEHILHGASVDAADGNPNRPSFSGDDEFYSLDPNDCYLTAGQDIFFESLTGDVDYIDTSKSVYFSRGHLSPNADFLIEMEADATFFYTNAVPQWQAYNGGNWVYLENSGRDLAATHLYDITITQGPVQQLSVPDVSAIPTPVYICDTQSTKLIPIPEQVWKVLYDPVRDLGVAVVTSNAPHEQVITKVCDDVDCSTITWMWTSFAPDDATKGTSYCCTVQALRAVVPNAPDYPNAGVLLT